MVVGAQDWGIWNTCKLINNDISEMRKGMRVVGCGLVGVRSTLVPTSAQLVDPLKDLT